MVGQVTFKLFCKMKPGDFELTIFFDISIYDYNIYNGSLSHAVYNK